MQRAQEYKDRRDCSAEEWKKGESIGFEKGGALDRESAGDWTKGESQRERGVLE